jgi:tRNA_anti-like
MSISRKNIVFFILAVIIIAGAIGFYFYNKGPVSVKNAAAIKTEAAALYQSFLKDSTAAKKTYLNNILEVSGLVMKVSKNQENQAIVMLQTNEGGAYVNCTMEEDVAGLVENKQATLKGICTGMGMGDADLGIMGDVYLVRCYLVK